MNPDLLKTVGSADWLEALRRRVGAVHEALGSVGVTPTDGVTFEVGGVVVRANWGADIANLTIGSTDVNDANAFQLVVPLAWVRDSPDEKAVRGILDR